MSHDTDETRQHFEARNLDQQMKNAYAEFSADPNAPSRRLMAEAYGSLGALVLVFVIFGVFFLVF
jgi:hypothetical protein